MRITYLKEGIEKLASTVILVPTVKYVISGNTYTY
jgi:hypothetical protein